MLVSLLRCWPRGLDAGLPALMMFAIVPRETSSRPYVCWPAGLLASMPGFFAASCLPHNLPLYYWLLPICRLLSLCRFVSACWPRCLASCCLRFGLLGDSRKPVFLSPSVWSFAFRWLHCFRAFDLCRLLLPCFLLFLLPPIFILGGPS